jgi:hypothetical protein
MKHTRVCAAQNCTRVLSPGEQCPEHGRDPNKPRDRHRTREYMNDHNRLRRQLKAQGRGNTCERCGTTAPTDMHHIKPDNNPASVQFLCSSCHRAVDHWAR